MAHQATKAKMNVLTVASSLIAIAMTLSLVASFPEHSPFPPQVGAVATLLLAFSYTYGLMTKKSYLSTASVMGLFLLLLHEAMFTTPTGASLGLLLLRTTTTLFLLQLFSLRTTVSRILDNLNKEEDKHNLVLLHHLDTHLSDRLPTITGLMIVNYLLSLALLVLGGILGVRAGDYFPSSLGLALIAVCLIVLALWGEVE